MTSYFVVSGSPPGTGSDVVEALVVSRGDELVVLGTGPVASDLRDVAGWPGATIESVTSGLAYHLVDGPHVFDSDDLDALAAVYGLRPR